MLLQHRRLRSRRWLWWAISLVLVAVGVVLIVVSLNGPKMGPNIPGPIGKTIAPALQSPRLAADETTTDNSTTTPSVMLDSYPAPSSTPAKAGPRSSHLAVIKRSIPVRITIPAIHVNATVGELGLNKDGSVQVPSGWYTTGWYKYGPAPGQLGSAVILGHIDSVAGPAVFYELPLLRPGNLINVKLKSGVTVHFAVIGLREWKKTALPDRLVFGPRSYDALNLVTCGGQFDYSTHHYLSNIVVFAKRVK